MAIFNARREEDNGRIRLGPCIAKYMPLYGPKRVIRGIIKEGECRRGNFEIKITEKNR